MSSAHSRAGSNPELNIQSIGDFGEIRRDISHRLFLDPSYGVFDAMGEMSVAAEDYIAELAEHFPPNVPIY